MRFLSTFSQLQPLILKKVFTRAWTNIHTANSCVCVPLVSEPLLLVCKHATVFICACVFAIHKRAAILDKAHHTHEDKKDVNTGSDDGRAQECSFGQP